MTDEKPSTKTKADPKKVQKPPAEAAEEGQSEEQSQERPIEKGGFENRPEPTRYGDWDVNGRCSDF